MSDAKKNSAVFPPRFFYWLNPGEFEQAKARLKREKKRIMPINGIACKVMHPLVELGCVMPDVWDQKCQRQGAWYRTSSKNGKILLVSLNVPEFLKESLSGIISLSSFMPSAPPDIKAALTLSHQTEYTSREPVGWRKISHRERRYWKKLLLRFGETKSLDEMIELHSANHANFISPRLYFREQGKIVPYSLGKTKHVCSACIELFNILGEDFDKKYVMPCPGFVLFAQYEPDRYLEVLSGRDGI